MIKLELSDTIKEIHKEYFKEKINFGQEIDIKKNELSKINTELNSTYKIKEIQKIHLDFLDYCKLISDTLSIGSVKELKSIINKFDKINEIDENFERFDVIKAMLTNDIQCRFTQNKKYKKYSDILGDIFGYKNFSGKTIEEIGSIENINNKDKDEIKESIKNSKYKFSQKTIDDIVTIIYDKWKIDKQYIIKKIDKGKFLDYWCGYLFVYLIDIRVCPYCNRQYITPVLKKDGKMRGDLDHFLPKSKYPYLSMSIYNLIPVCKFCNSSFKGTEEFEEDDLNPYEDSFDDYVKFCFDMDLESNIDIKIKKYDDNNSNVDNYINMFKLNDQYQYHTNKVEELIYKRLMYSEEYINDIRDKFFGSSISTEQLKETIIGYTSEKSKINDEPLSKLKRDIVSQLRFFENPEKELVEKLEKVLKDEI